MRAREAFQSPIRFQKKKVGDFAVEHKLYRKDECVTVVSPRSAIMTGQRIIKVQPAQDLLVHRLVRDGDTLMSDHPQELYQMNNFVRKARGRVLIGGLGLSVVARLVAQKPEVSSVEVIEIEPDIVKLCGQDLPSKVTVRQADLFAFLRELKVWWWDHAFFDIWYPTSEMEWVTTVAPLRRLVRSKFGARKLECWAEPEMLGQMVGSLANQRCAELKDLHWSPAHYAFRKATIGAYPRVCMKPEAHFLCGEEIKKDPAFMGLMRLFLTQVGSPKWEKMFGTAWDELNEEKEKRCSRVGG